MLSTVYCRILNEQDTPFLSRCNIRIILGSYTHTDLLISIKFAQLNVKNHQGILFKTTLMTLWSISHAMFRLPLSSGWFQLYTLRALKTSTIARDLERALTWTFFGAPDQRRLIIGGGGARR